MIRVPFRDIMEGVLAHCGQKFDATLADQQSILCTFISMRVQEGWGFGPWRDIARCEERPFADKWSAEQSYVIGDIVYDVATSKYYAALTDNQNVVPSTHATDWQANANPVHVIANEQYGAEKIGSVWNVTSRDPRKFRDLMTYDFLPSGNGTYVQGCSANTTWIHFSNPAPRFTGKAYKQEDASSYKRGAIIFYPGTESGLFPNTGECYRAELDANGAAIWILIPFPQVLQGFVVAAAGADMQRYYGKSEEATELENKAYANLWNEAHKNGIGANVVISGR